MNKYEEFDEFVRRMIPAAKRHFCPGGRYHGKEGQLFFAKEAFAAVFALDGYTEKDIKDNIGKCYGALVRCVFGTPNKVEVDNKEFVETIRERIVTIREDMAERDRLLREIQAEREAQNGST